MFSVGLLPEYKKSQAHILATKLGVAYDRDDSADKILRAVMCKPLHLFPYNNRFCRAIVQLPFSWEIRVFQSREFF